MPAKSGGCADSAIKGFLILSLVATLGVGGCFVLVMGLGYSKRARNAATVPVATATASPSPKPTVDNRRLWRQNERLDDSAREYIFKAALRKADQRCDSVESQIMREPGEWTVRCAPGYRYLFKFNEEGDLIAAVRAP